MKIRLLLLAGLATLFVGLSEGRAQPGGPGGPPNAPNGPGGGRGFPGGRMGGGDPSQFFDQLANGKDVWNRAETDARLQRLFDRIASTLGITNGQITRQQFMAYQEQRNAQRGRGAGGGRNPDSTAEGMFSRLDANGDGLLNYDEMPPDLRSERELWDKDRNGLIDLAEFKAYYQARIQPPPAAQQSAGAANNNQQDQQWPGYWGGWDYAPQAPAEEERKPPVVYRPGKLPKELPTWFTQVDTDQDGQIGLYEWKAAGRSIQDFDEMDRNKDGFLTVDEVLFFVNKGKENNGQSGTQQGYALNNGGFGGPNWGRGFGPGGFGGPGFGRRGFGPGGFGPGGFGPQGGDRGNGGGRGGRGGRNRDRGGSGGDN